MNDHLLKSTDSLEYITKVGMEFYLQDLKEKLEKTENGKYLVLEVDSKTYFIDEDLLDAIEKAEEKFPDKLFFIVQIGTLQDPFVYQKEI
jgi:hypothetical protein